MKAKDLRGKDVEDLEAGQDDDQVAAAYENISKRLESIRNGKTPDDGDDEPKGREEAPEKSEEPELEEWKGPSKPVLKDEEPEEEEHELKKVDLKNLEDEEDKKPKKEEEEDEIDPLDEEDDDEDAKAPKDEDEEEAPVKSAVTKEWEPKENDPLDEEDEDEKQDDRDEKDEPEEVAHKAVKEDEDESESLHSEVRRPVESEPADMPEDRDEIKREEPDTLDDLAAESPFGRKETPESEESAADELPYHKDAAEEDEYSIPNLKGSRQDPAHMGYNANPQKESVGQSYSPKGNYMEGNDPNNFFSNHPNQPPKRANKFHLLVLVVIGIAVIGFTVYVLKGGVGGINLGTSTESSPSPSATATPEPTPTPTPEPEVERGNFTVRVLNGTSTSGLAKTVSDKLKEAGYKTAAPGNAEDSDVAQTEIKVKEGTESAALFERLKLDLAPDYEAVKGGDLDSKSKNDAEVIVGAK